MKCQGICGQELIRKPGETLKQLNARKGCGSPECDSEIRYQAKEKARIKNNKRYYVQPDITENFYLGRY